MTTLNHWHQKIPMTVRFVLLTVITMLFSGCNLQHKLLYFPSTTLPNEKFLAAAQLKLWPTSSSTEYRALVSTHEASHPQGTILVFHGNGGTALDRVFYMETLAALGYRVILAEYPRYGGRKGDLGEKAFVADALVTTRLAYKQFGPPLFILGESLGCGIAAAVVEEKSVPIKGVILLTPWIPWQRLPNLNSPFCRFDSFLPIAMTPLLISDHFLERSL